MKPLSRTSPCVGQPDGAGAGVDGGAEPLEAAGEDGAGRGADLAAEQVLAALDDLGREAAHRQGPGDLEAEQPAADDDGAAGAGQRRRPGRRQSSRLRKACTFGCRLPSIRTSPRIGGSVGMLPVASTSRS